MLLVNCISDVVTYIVITDVKINKDVELHLWVGGRGGGGGKG